MKFPLPVVKEADAVRGWAGHDDPETTSLFFRRPLNRNRDCFTSTNANGSDPTADLAAP